MLKAHRAVDLARIIVRKAGVVAPLISEDESVSQIERLAIRDLAQALLIERVCYRVLDLLKRHESETVDELMADAVFSNHMRRLQTVANNRTTILAALDKAGRDLGTAVHAIKGLCARTWYADPHLRDLGDVDIMVGSVDGALRLTAVLRQQGYTFDQREPPWLKRSPDTHSLYGQFKLKFVDPNGLPNIDIHFGGYSVRHCGLHVLNHQDCQAGLSYYSRQDNIPLLVANAAGDHRITTKDVNDLLHCLDCEDVRWEQVLLELESVALVPFFNVMLRLVGESCRLTVAQQRALEGMLRPTRPEWPEPATHRSWERRWLATVKHAFTLGARHSYGRAITSALTASRYYWRPRRLAVKSRALPVRPVSRMPELNPWTCVRLVPVELLERIMTQSDHAPLGPSFLGFTGSSKALSAELSTVRLQHGDIVRSNVGDFLPTVYDGLDGRLTALVSNRP